MKWIKCSDRFPEINQRVLVYQKGGVYGGNLIDIEYRCSEAFWQDQGIYSEISHWMELPEPPRDDE